jgi:hypothetical protein
VRPRLIALIVAAALVAGCGGGDHGYAREDLPKVVLLPSEAPKGLHYWRRQSGASMLEKEGQESAEGLRILRSLGFRGDYGSQFVPRSRSAPVQYAESFAVLFRDDTGARRALAIFKRRQRRSGHGARELDAAGLGDEAWALRGVFFPGAPPTFFYAWRRANLMVGFALAGKPGAVTEADARAYAGRLDDRAAEAA